MMYLPIQQLIRKRHEAFTPIRQGINEMAKIIFEL